MWAMDRCPQNEVSISTERKADSEYSRLSQQI